MALIAPCPSLSHSRYPSAAAPTRPGCPGYFCGKMQIMTVEVNSRADFTLGNYARVSAGGEGIVIGGQARPAMTAARTAFTALLESGTPVYGTTTRPGIEVARTLTPDEQRQARWITQGERSASFSADALAGPVVRGIVFARLANYVEGHAKSRPEVADAIAGLLAGPLPRIPLRGEVGPGEVVPLAHLMEPLRIGLQPGERMALVNGSPCAAALCADAAISAAGRLDAAAAVLALSAEAFRAPLEAYDAALDDLWGDPGEAWALARLRSWLHGAEPDGRLGHQAPVSYRIMPKVLGRAWRAVTEARRAAQVSLRSVSDNPVFIPPGEQHRDGRVFSTGGYHNGLTAPALDGLSAAWADLVLVAERHVTALHVGQTAGHLPPLLARPGGQGGRTNLLGWVAGSYLEEARAAATVTLLPPGWADAQNDIAAPSFSAYRKLQQVDSCLDAALALLAASSSQALWVTDRVAAPPLRPLLERVRSFVPPLDDPAQRHLGGELAGLSAAIPRILTPADHLP